MSAQMTIATKTPDNSASYSESLGTHISSLTYDGVPAAIQGKLKTCLLYGLVMSATASGIDTLERAALAAHDAPGKARTLISGHSLRAADAAYVNALRMCSRGQNDTFSNLYAHPGCIVIPVVLALAQQQGATGKQVITALAAGYETLYAVAAGYAEAVLKRGLRATSAFGVYASTAAAARMMDLDAAQTAHALGLATQHSAGTMQCWVEGSPEWRLQVASAARAGIVCATLARHGYTSARYALEGENGFYRAFVGMAPHALPAWTWHTQEVVFKPLPGCLINQAPLYLLLSMQREHNFGVHDVKTIRVALSNRNADYPGITRHGPFETPTGAIMSGPFMLAVGLRNGTLRTQDFETMFGPNDIHAHSACIEVVGAAGLPDWGAEVEVTLNGGRGFKARLVELSQFAFNWEETDRQLSLMQQEWPWKDSARRYERLKASVQQLDRLSNVDPIVDALVFTP